MSNMQLKIYNWVFLNGNQVVESIICKETIFWTGCQKVDEKDYWYSILKLNLNIL